MMTALGLELYSVRASVWQLFYALQIYREPMRSELWRFLQSGDV